VEIHFSPDKEARLQQFAARTGKDASQLIEEAVDRMLDSDSHFIDAVEEGRASARRGELLDHEEVVGADREDTPLLILVRRTTRAADNFACESGWLQDTKGLL